MQLKLAIAIAASAGLTLATHCNADPLMTRGLYLDSGGNIPGPDELRQLGITEVHLFINENCIPTKCWNKSQTFAYENGWSATSVRNTLKALQKDFKLAIIFSPRYRSRTFIDSLKGKDGPLTIANEFPAADVELDVELNFSEKLTTKDSATDLDPKDAATYLLKTIKDYVNFDRRHLIVSTTLTYTGDHATLEAGADTISPQIYDGHWSYEPQDTQRSLNAFLVRYPDKRIVPALSVECDGDRAYRKGLCSETNYQVARLLTASMNACDQSRYPGYMIWGANELNTKCQGVKGDKAVCSYFGERALKREAQSDPVTSCNIGLSVSENAKLAARKTGN
jgi:hypothetical protein